MLNFFLTIILARNIGAEGLGIYNFMVTLLIIGTTISMMGLNNLLTKMIPPLIVTASDKIAKLVSSVQLKVCVSSVSVGLIFLTIGFLAPQFGYSTLISDSFYFAGLGLGAYSMVVLSADYLRTLNKPSISGFFQFTALPLILGFIVLQVDSLTYEDLLIDHLAIMLLLALILVVYSKKITPKKSNNVNYSGLVKNARPFYWIKIFNLPMTYSDTFILGLLVSAFDFGLYTTALKVILLTNFVTQAFSFIAAPKISEFISFERQSDLKNFIKKISLGMILLVSPISIVSIFFPGVILSVFGHEFLGASTALTILSIAQFINIATGIVGTVLTYSGNQKTVLYTNLSAGIVNIVLCLILTPSMGINGAAIASSVAIAGSNIALTWIVYKEFGFLSVPFKLSLLERN